MDSLTPDRTDTDTASIVETFLSRLAHGATDDAVAMLTDDIAWTNIGTPTLRGIGLVGRSIRSMNSPWLRFDVIVHNIATDGDVVLTERTDLLAVGPLAVEFWVCGTFVVRDGRIAVWRDYFSLRDMLRGLAVGVFRLATGRRGGRSTGYLGA